MARTLSALLARERSNLCKVHDLDISDSPESLAPEDLISFKRSAPKLRTRSRTSDDGTWDGSSTESGDDSASVSLPASAEGISSDSDVESVDVTTVYSVGLLFQLGALLAQSKSNSNSLGYRTEHRPQLPPTPEKSPSWVSQRRSRDVNGSDEVIARKARSILNKLSIEKFDHLYEQLATCGITTACHLKQLMHEIFEKATAQHHFIPMYADVCVRLESDRRIVLHSSGDGAVKDFRGLLLDACQTAFEELLEARAINCSETEEQLKRKQRALGNVKLVGELMVRGMLSSRLLVQCAEDLLRARSMCAEALESLAVFLQVAAPKFDEPSWVHATKLDSVFRKVLEISKDKTVQARERFLLRDVLDQRDARWPGRSPAICSSRPMKLEEVMMTREREKAPVAALGARLQTHPPVLPWRALATAAEVDVESPLKSPVSSAPSSPCSTTASEKIQSEKQPFSPIAFRRVLAGIMKELAQGWNVPAAVRRVREQGVPLDQQAGEFVDILTRAAEEPRGPARRSAFAFAAGLAAADGTSAFDRSACLEGTHVFFQEVFQDLCDEVPRLATIIKAELLPTLRSVLPEGRLRPLCPPELWTC